MKRIPEQVRPGIHPLTGEFRDSAKEHAYRLASDETLRRHSIQVGLLAVAALFALIVTDHMYAPGGLEIIWISIARCLALIPPALMVWAAVRKWRYQAVDSLFTIFAIVMVADSVTMIWVFRDDTVMMAARLPLYAMIANVMFSPGFIHRTIANISAWSCLLIAFWTLTPDPWTSAPAITVILSVGFIFGIVAGTWLIHLRRKEYFRASELEQANSSLSQYKQELEQAVLAKTMFLSNVSHELRTPLNAIIGFSDMIKMQMYGPIGSPKYKEYVQDIQNSGNHLLALINDILDLNRLEAGKAAMTPEWIPVHQAFQDCRKVVLAAHGNLRKDRVKLNGPQELFVYFDGRALHQILVNLLTNAVKYAGPEAVITLDADFLPDGGATLKVTDNGAGMDGEVLDRMMRPFEQADAVTARQSDGWGLGLPLANALSSANEAELHLESTPGKGTVVKLLIPAKRTSMGHREQDSSLALSA